MLYIEAINGSNTMTSNFECSQRVGRSYLLVLSTLLFLFCLRVLGQILVAVYHVSFLPPMQQWYSGLIPYPILVVCQIAIIGLLGKVCFDFARRRGFFVATRAKLGALCINFGSVYLFVMIARYILRMSFYPTERWFGGSIPILFHWVLASFVLVLGHYHWRSPGKV